VHVNVDVDVVVHVLELLKLFKNLGARTTGAKGRVQEECRSI
jgi:hypothetical protein